MTFLTLHYHSQSRVKILIVIAQNISLNVLKSIPMFVRKIICKHSNVLPFNMAYENSLRKKESKADLLTLPTVHACSEKQYETILVYCTYL